MTDNKSDNTTPRLRFYHVGVNNYKLFFVAASSPRNAERVISSVIPWYQRWRKVRAKEDIDPVELSGRGYEIKMAMVDYVAD